MRRTISMLGSICAALLSISMLNFATASIIDGGIVTNETQWVDQGFGSTAYTFFQVSNNSVDGGELSGGYISLTKLSSSSNAGDNSTRIPIQDTSGVGTMDVGAWFTTGLNDNNLIDVAQFDFGAGTDSALRVGVLVGAHGNLAIGGADPLDYPQEIAISDGLNMFTHTVTKPASQQADWYFFDVDGIMNGTQLTVSASRISGDAGHLHNPINGVVFAVNAVPEPSSVVIWTLLGMAFVGYFAWRRRKA